jgi:hypothetical protein
MTRGWVLPAVLALTYGCSAIEPPTAVRPPGTHFSAAFVRDATLVVFPYRGTKIEIALPVRLGAMSFAASGKAIYGFDMSTSGARGGIVEIDLKSKAVDVLPGSAEFRAVNGLAVIGGTALVSGVRENQGAPECGLFSLDLTTRRVEQITGGTAPSCESGSSWSSLSLSADGARGAGTAGRGRVGVIDVRGHRVEKVWPGVSAAWSPDGRWIVTTEPSSAMVMDLIAAADLSLVRKLGEAGSVGPVWSPDSAHLLLWRSSLSCGLAAGYAGSLDVLEVASGRTSTIQSSRCQVNLASTGWVDDSILP